MSNYTNSYKTDFLFIYLFLNFVFTVFESCGFKEGKVSISLVFLGF